MRKWREWKKNIIFVGNNNNCIQHEKQFYYSIHLLSNGKKIVCSTHGSVEKISSDQKDETHKIDK